MSVAVQVSLGALFVLLNAIHRFNTPPTVRSTTTWPRFYAAAVGYGLLLVAAYLLLIFAPPVLEAVLVGANIPQAVGNTVREPLLIALLLTILLPALPVLEPLDKWLRESLQDKAEIPHEARRLANEMRDAPFAVPGSIRTRVREELLRHAFEPDDAVFDQSDVPRGTWTKVASLIVQLREWETDRRYAAFIGRVGEEHARVLRRYQQLSPKVRRWLKTARALHADKGADVAEVAHQYQADLLDQCSELLTELYVFVSKALLRCELTYASRTARLRALGFDLLVQPRRLTLNRIMALFGLISVVIIFGLTFVQEWIRMLLSDASPTPTVPRISAVLSRTVMIGVIYVVATSCAILPKERWVSARREQGGERPIVFYFLSGVMAAAASLLVSFLFGFLVEWNIKAAWALFLVRHPWALMSFMTAFTAAWLADNVTSAKGNARQRRAEGLLQAAVSVATAGLVLLWLDQVAHPAPPNLPARYALPDPPSALLRAALIGFVIGFKVPTWYREAPREAEAVTPVGASLPVDLRTSPPGAAAIVAQGTRTEGTVLDEAVGRPEAALRNGAGGASEGA